MIRNEFPMRVVVQRVKRASVRIGGELHSSIEAGLLILLGVEDSDESSDIEWLVKKCANLRIFDDENGVMNRSLIDMNGEVMTVSQFTLMASTRRGTGPLISGRPDMSTLSLCTRLFAVVFRRKFPKRWLRVSSAPTCR